MKTEIKKTIITNTQEICFGYWNEEKQEWLPITLENIDEVTEILGTVDLLKALITSFDFIKDSVNSDLMDIWKRLDRIEKQIKDSMNADFDARVMNRIRKKSVPKWDNG